ERVSPARVAGVVLLAGGLLGLRSLPVAAAPATRAAGDSAELGQRLSAAAGAAGRAPGPGVAGFPARRGFPCAVTEHAALAKARGGRETGGARGGGGGRGKEF